MIHRDRLTARLEGEFAVFPIGLGVCRPGRPATVRWALAASGLQSAAGRLHR